MVAQYSRNKVADVSPQIRRANIKQHNYDKMNANVKNQLTQTRLQTDTQSH